MPNTYRIQVITKDETEIGTYQDAQYFDIPTDMTIEQFQKENESVIDAEKSKRIANWIDAVKNPPIMPEPTKEQLEQESVAIDEQIAQLQARKVDVSEAIMTIDSYEELKDIKGK